MNCMFFFQSVLTDLRWQKHVIVRMVPQSVVGVILMKNICPKALFFFPSTFLHSCQILPESKKESFQGQLVCACL